MSDEGFFLADDAPAELVIYHYAELMAHRRLLRDGFIRPDMEDTVRGMIDDLHRSIPPHVHAQVAAGEIQDFLADL